MVAKSPLGGLSVYPNTYRPSTILLVVDFFHPQKLLLGADPTEAHGISLPLRQRRSKLSIRPAETRSNVGIPYQPQGLDHCMTEYSVYWACPQMGDHDEKIANQS